jgi:hypothetical protein
MFRTSRTTAAIIRHLMLGTAATVAAAVLVPSLVSCKSESEPDYWVDKLEDQSWRPRAIKRLEQFFEDAATKANKNMDDPAVKALLDKIAVPMTQCYVDHYADFGSDTKTRVELIKVIAGFRDKRTEPALKKALEEWVKKPTKDEEATDIRWAIRAQKDLKLPALQDLILQTFLKVEAHSALGALVYKDLRDTMVAFPDKSWAAPLRKALEPEIPEFTKDTQGPVKNQVYWQTVAALLLGDLRDSESVEPLMRIVLDPSKGNVATTAVLALVKIGDPAINAAIKLLKGQDQKLADYHIAKVVKAGKLKEPPKDQPYVWMAAVMLGTSSSPKAVAPLLEVLKSNQYDTNKATILDELSKLPVSAESKAAFQEGFSALPVGAMNVRGEKALPFLVEESVARFFDSGMLDWLVGYMDAFKGEDEVKKDIQAQVLLTYIKLAKPAQMAKAKELVDKWGTAGEKGVKFEAKLLAQAQKVVAECGEKADCYAAYLEKSDAQKKENEFEGIKAAYMVGVLGNEETALELVDRVDGIENTSVLMAALKALDHLLPKGNTKVADKLNEILEAHAKSADSYKQQSDNVIREIMYRIRARAGA